MIITDKEEFTCNECQQTKLGTKKPFTDGHREEKRFLERVHFDIMGPISPIAESGANYVSHHVDAYSGLIWARIGRNIRSSNLETFQAFHQSVGIPETYRMDNAAENTAHSIRQLARENRIRLEFTAPHTPQQNTIVEASFRTITQDVQALLLWSRLPKTYWEHAWRYAIFVRNRAVHALKELTRLELATGDLIWEVFVALDVWHGFTFQKHSARSWMNALFLEFILDLHPIVLHTKSSYPTEESSHHDPWHSRRTNQLDFSSLHHPHPRHHLISKYLLLHHLHHHHLLRPGSLRDRTKHIGTRLAFIRTHLKEYTIQLQHIPRQCQIADMLAKYPPPHEFISLRDSFMSFAPIS